MLSSSRSPRSGVPSAACPEETDSSARCWDSARLAAPAAGTPPWLPRQLWVKFKVPLTTHKALNGPTGPDTHGERDGDEGVCRAQPSLARTWQRRRQQLVQGPSSALGMTLINIFHQWAWQEAGEGGRKAKLGYWDDQQQRTDLTGWGWEAPSSRPFPTPLYSRLPRLNFSSISRLVSPPARSGLSQCQGMAGDKGPAGRQEKEKCWSVFPSPRTHVQLSVHRDGHKSPAPAWKSGALRR